jgi:hypothetical protein
MIAGIMIGLIFVTVLIVMFSIGFHPFLILLLLIPFLYLAGMYRSRKPSKGKLKRDARSLEKTFLRVLLQDILVIDTPLWCNENYNSFFNALSIIFAANNKKIVLFDRQHDEIQIEQKIHAGEDPTGKLSNTKQMVQQFLDKNLIALEPMDFSDEHDITDEPLPVKLLICAAKESRNVTLISDNRGLIARARTVLKARKVGITIIDYLEDLIPACNEYCAAVREGTIQPFSGKRR